MSPLPKNSYQQHPGGVRSTPDVAHACCWLCHAYTPTPHGPKAHGPTPQAPRSSHARPRAAPIPCLAPLLTRLIPIRMSAGATSSWHPKHSSTGWGRYIYRPPPQMGHAKASLPCPHQNSWEIQKRSLALGYRLTARPNPPIFCSDSPKSGVKWLIVTNLLRETLPAVAVAVLKAQRTSPR